MLVYVLEASSSTVTFRFACVFIIVAMQCIVCNSLRVQLVDELILSDVHTKKLSLQVNYLCNMF